MKNSECEDQSFSQRVLSFHKKEMGEFEVPKWANVACPHCGYDKLDMSSIRNIGSRFNARNIGDVSVEIYCNECGVMDSVYFRKQFTDIKGYIELLDGTREPDCEPVVEQKMYKQQYNNLVERMSQEEVDS
jgi:hypothetical protein